MSSGSRLYTRRNVELDPLFAAEGADLAEAEESLDYIEAFARRLEVLLATGSLAKRLFFIRDPIARSVLPVPFIRALISAERARREYKTSPSEYAERALLDSWAAAAKAYASSVKRYRRVHDILYRLEPAGASYQLQDLFGNISSFAYVQRFLEQLSENAEQLNREVAQYGASPAARPRSRMLDIEPCAYPEMYRRLHELEVSEGITPFRWSRIERSYGPYSCMLSHVDGRPTRHACMLYLLRDDKIGLSSMWVALLDTFMFTRIWREIPKDSSSGKVPFVFSGGITSEDTPYWYEAAGHLYVTRDPSYWMDVATYADLKSRPGLDADAVSAQRSSLLGRMLGACADDLRGFVRHTERRLRGGKLDSYSLLYGLLMRSHPALLFLTCNASVWRLEDPAQLLGDSRSSNHESPYVPQSEVLSAVSDEDLKKVMGAQALREKREREQGFID